MMDTNNNPAATPTTSSWKIGHAVIQIIHIVWLVLQLIYHFSFMISYYTNKIPGYATADLLIILLCFFLLAVAIIGLVAIFTPEGSMLPELVRARMIKLNTMVYVLGMQYFTFIYLLLWITEFAHTPLLLNMSTLNGFVVSTLLAFVHPGVAIIPFVIQLVIGIIGAFTAINFYLFTERVRVAKILAPYKPKIEGATIIVQQAQQAYYPPQQMYTAQPTAQYYPQQQQEVYPNMQMQQQPTAQYYPQEQVYQQPIVQDVKTETTTYVPVVIPQEQPVTNQGMVNVEIQQ